MADETEKPKSNVIRFERKQSANALSMYICDAETEDGGSCGCMLWYHYTDGSTQCVLCHTEYDADNGEMVH